MTVRQKFRLASLAIGLVGWSLPFLSWPDWLVVPDGYFWIVLPFLVAAAAALCLPGLWLVVKFDEMYAAALKDGPWEKWETWGGFLCALPWLLAFAGVER